jgi:2-hydroxycyclohexanecarboxyl-CoA dehydrogenase
MDMQLQDRVVLISGAGSGIGQSIALAFGEEGAAVVVNDLDAAACEATLGLLRAAGVRCAAAPFDVSQLRQVQAGVKQAEQPFGTVDVLINCAAVIINNKPFVESMPEECEREIQVSLFGTMHCTRATLPGMIARGSGRIINIVSDAARVGQEREVAYSSAKGGIISFTKSLAREVGRHGITVNAVSPAATDTPLRRALLQRMAEKIGAEAVEAREEKIRKAYPLKRIGKPEDTAALVTFLASSRASNITGQIHSVNGGFAMPG